MSLVKRSLNSGSSLWTLSSTNVYSAITNTITVGTSTTSRDIFTVNADGILGNGLWIDQTMGTGGTISANLLVVAGGSGGGYDRAGGGAAGGYRPIAAYSLTYGNSYSVTVGSGGLGGTISTKRGGAGGDSIFGTITATGGGPGGSTIATDLNGQPGGSGSGAAGTSGSAGTGGAGNTPSTSPSQGNNGGNAALNNGGGGGGSAAAGGNAVNSSSAGAGGAGTSNSISGAALFYAAGGGGGSSHGLGTHGTGGSSIGGDGSDGNNGSAPGQNAAANTGSGGGGAGDNSNGGNGSAGIVIISYPSAGVIDGTGGTITHVGGNTIHTFTTSGTFVAPVKPASPTLTFSAGGIKTAKIWTDGNNSSQLTFTMGTTDYASLNSSGVATFLGQLIGKGTATNDSAATGYIGEYVTASLASGSATSLTNVTAKTVVSISLTAGDWDVTGVVDFHPDTTTTTTYLRAGISTTNNTLGAVDTYSTNPFAIAVTSVDAAEITPTVRLSLSTTTTVYLIAMGGFAISTLTAYGTIRARRMR